MDLLETPSGRARAEDLMERILPKTVNRGEVMVLKLKSQVC